MTGTPGGQLSWSDKVEKLTIGSLDNVHLTVEAQYNPRELQIDKQISWQQPSCLPGTEGARDGDQDEVEVTSAPTRSMSVNLLFDGFEDHRSVQPEIDKLETLSSIQEPGSKKQPLRRPHHCVVTWGVAGTKAFCCVIDSLTVKMTMFAPGGAPLRATCTVKLREVHVLSKLGAT